MLPDNEIQRNFVEINLPNRNLTNRNENSKCKSNKEILLGIQETFQRKNFS